MRHPLEDGTYFTPAKTNEKFEYYTEHYSPDPYVAAAQREEWMTANTGDGVAPNPSLSRKSKDPGVKEEKPNIIVVKKSKVKRNRHKHSKKHWTKRIYLDYRWKIHQLAKMTILVMRKWKGSLRYQDGHGSEKVSLKVTFLSLKLQGDDPNSLTMLNVG